MRTRWARLVRRHPWLYAGLKYRCDCCDRRLRRYQSHRGRRGARCPACLSLERHRAFARYLRTVDISGTVLHFAPEPALRRLIEPRAGRYVTSDIAPGHDVQADIQRLPLPDAFADVIVCNHVLEHVGDDRRAIRELRRVLKPGGVLLTQHPVHPHPVTLEDPAVTDPADRLRVFGQEDHVRKYGQDFIDRLRASFAVQRVTIDGRDVYACR